jgi:hypothetical protein
MQCPEVVPPARAGIVTFHDLRRDGAPDVVWNPRTRILPRRDFVNNLSISCVSHDRLDSRNAHALAADGSHIVIIWSFLFSYSSRWHWSHCGCCGARFHGSLSNNAARGMGCREPTHRDRGASARHGRRRHERATRGRRRMARQDSSRPPAMGRRLRARRVGVEIKTVIRDC